MSQLTHLDETGAARMVDVSDKIMSAREAVATGRVTMRRETAALITDGAMKKGDVLATARLAGIMAAKRAAEIIPLCHPIPISGIQVELEVREESVQIRATVRTVGNTGVEMEALTAVSAAALTIYDMAKAVDRGMVIEAVRLERKTGGVHGDWEREP